MNTEISQEDLDAAYRVAAKYGSIGGQATKKKWANMSQEEKERIISKKNETMKRNKSKFGRKRSG